MLVGTSQSKLTGVHPVRLAILTIISAVAVMVVFVACSGTQQKPNVELTVFADQSLKQPVTAIADDYTSSHPGTAITLTFGAGPALAAQILNTASADVFVAADEQSIRPVIEGGEAQTSTIFATNRMVIAVPKENPRGIRSPADLSKTGTKLAACTPGKPCGELATRFLNEIAAAVKPSTTVDSTAVVLDLVRAASVDAGLVYMTDVQSAAGGVIAITMPNSQDLVTELPVAVLKGGAQSQAASMFVQFLQSDKAQVRLTSAGLGVPAD